MGAPASKLDCVRQIAIVAKGQEELGRIKKLFDPYASDVQLHAFPSIREFVEHKSDALWSGFVVDFATLIKSKNNEKGEFLRTIEAFPLLKIKVPSSGGITGIVGDENYAGQELLEHYVNRAITNYEPRMLRQHKRIERLLSLRFRRDEKSQDWFRATSADISNGGMYVLTPDPFKRGHVIELDLPEFDGIKTKAEVRWSLPWGVSRTKFPGMGLQFIDPPEGLREVIRDLSDF